MSLFLLSAPLKGFPQEFGPSFRKRYPGKQAGVPIEFVPLEYAAESRI